MAHKIEWNEREKKLYLDFHLGIARERAIKDIEEVASKAERAVRLAGEALWELQYRGGNLEDVRPILEALSERLHAATLEVNHILTPDH